MPPLHQWCLGFLCRTISDPWKQWPWTQQCPRHNMCHNQAAVTGVQSNGAWTWAFTALLVYTEFCFKIVCEQITLPFLSSYHVQEEYEKVNLLMWSIFTGQDILMNMNMSIVSSPPSPRDVFVGKLLEQVKIAKSCWRGVVVASSAVSSSFGLDKLHREGYGFKHEQILIWKSFSSNE